MPFRRGFLSLGAALLLASCTDATAPVVPTPTTLTPEVEVVSLDHLGQRRTVGVTVRDADGAVMTGVEVTWRSSEPSVATVSAVSAGGEVAATGEGSTVLTATAGTAEATVVVNVRQIAATLVISEPAWSFGALGDTLRLQVEVLDAGGSALPSPSVVWSSGDPSVVSVDPAGLLTARGNGGTRVSAASGDAVAEVAVSVEQRAARVVVAEDSVVLHDPGDEVTLPVVVTDSLGGLVSAPGLLWRSTDASVVQVDDGVVTGVGTGAAEVVVTSGTVADTVPVRVRPELSLVVLADASPSGTVDSELSLSVRVEDPDGTPEPGVSVTWSVDAGTLLSSGSSVSDVTGHAGASWRLGTTAGSQSATAAIQTRGSVVDVTFAATAEPGPATEVELLADSALLSARSETVFLSPGYADVFGNETEGVATWASRDPAVASVAADGLVTALAEGSTWITGGLETPTDSILVTVVMRGAITVTFDDGWRSAYEQAWPILRDMALPANVAVYTEAVGWPGYVTEAHLDELHAAGWAMVSHTVSHDSLSTLSVGELDYQLRASQAWIQDRGYRGANVLVAPYHDFGAAEKSAASTYYTAGRGTSSNAFVPDSLVAWMPDRPFDLTGIEADALPYTTAEGRNRLRDLLQRARDEGRFIDVFFHRVPVEDVDAFRSAMEVVAEFRDRVLPYDRLYPVWARVVE